MSLAKKILGNTFIQFVGRLLTAVLAIISVKLITSSLGVEGYGAYTTVYEFVGLFAIMGDLGLYTIAVREMAEREEKEHQKIYSNVLTMRAVLTAVVMICVGIGGIFIPAYQESLIPMGIWICTVAVWLNLFYSIVTSILQFHLKMGLATIALVAGKIAAVLAILAGVLFIKDPSQEFYTFIASGIIGHGVMLLFGIFFAHKYIRVSFGFDLQYWKYLIKKSWVYGLALILSTIYFKEAVTMLSIMRPQSDVGFYGVPLRMIEVLNVLPLFFMNSVLGTMVKAVKESKERVQQVFALSFQFLLIMVVPIFIFIYFFSPEIIRFISSPEFLSTPNSHGSDSVMLLLTIALIFYFFSTLFSFSLVAFHKQSSVLWVNGFGAIVNFATNLYFIPKYGFMGAAAMTILSEFVVFFVSFILLQRVFPFTFDFKVIGKTIFSGALAFGSLSFFVPFGGIQNHLIALLAGGTLMTIVYGAGVYFTGAIPKELLKRFI